MSKWRKTTTIRIKVRRKTGMCSMRVTQSVRSSSGLGRNSNGAAADYKFAQSPGRSSARTFLAKWKKKKKIDSIGMEDE